MKCPKCHKSLDKDKSNPAQNRDFPFCCARCRLLDLGAWLDSDYKIIAKGDRHHYQSEN